MNPQLSKIAIPKNKIIEKTRSGLVSMATGTDYIKNRKVKE